ncbi:hypothetical protein [Fusibacter sp. JL216-2]|uniref:hypothetical protein n=1 Tax=Fusibacter sp. JL216-2 TaxID=3071453 RepID=UPI003D346C22
MNYLVGTQNTSDILIQNSQESGDSKIYIPGEFGDGTKISIDGSMATILREWSEPLTIDGDIEINHYKLTTHSEDLVDYKRFRTNNVFINSIIEDSVNEQFHRLSLPNGITTKGYRKVGEWSSPNISILYSEGGKLELSIANMYSGWAKGYDPSPQEITAFFNGWVMYNSSSQMPYEGTGAKKWAKRFQGIGKTYELKMGVLVETNSATEVCPTEKAYGDITESYELQYQLKEPVVETVALENGFRLDKGTNKISLYTGIRKEKINVVKHTNGSRYYMNVIDHPYTGGKDSPFKKMTSEIIRVVTKANGIERDITDLCVYESSYAYGEERVSVSSSDVTDDEMDNVYVVYRTVDSLKERSNFFASITYDDSLNSVINSLIEQVLSLQSKVNVLQNNIDDFTSESGESIINFDYDDNGNLKKIESQ